MRGGYDRPHDPPQDHTLDLHTPHATPDEEQWPHVY